MRSDLRHTVFSAARFSDILRRSYRARPAISCFIAFAAQPGVSSPRCAPYYNTRPSKKNVKQFFDLFYNLFSYFSVETPIFSSPRLLWLFYPKHCVSFPSVSVITPRLFGISKQPFAPPRPAAGTDRPSSAKICHSDRSEKPGVSKKGKKFFARCNKTPPPRVISMNSKHPLKIAEKHTL